VLRIIGHTSALTLVALARTCHHMRHLCRAMVRARYCNQRGLPVKLRLPRADIWRITVETDVLKQSTLDDFEWHKTLGTGSFGRVRLVRHRRTGGYYAMKCLKKAMLLEHEQQDRLYWEKDIVRRSSIRSSCSSTARSRTASTSTLLFEFAAAARCFRLICEHGRLQARVVKFYAAETLLVLKYFAALNIVYRDIKPENLLLSADRAHQVHRLWLCRRAAAGEKSTAFLASAEYIAPEMILGKGYDGAVDMWSFGVLLYELLVGMPPFVGALTDISYNIFNTDGRLSGAHRRRRQGPHLKLLVLDPAEAAHARAGDAAPVVRTASTGTWSICACIRRRTCRRSSRAATRRSSTTTPRRARARSTEVAVDFEEFG
jgi:serine/threonine protein kinase